MRTKASNNAKVDSSQSARGLRFAIVSSRFNAEICKGLESGATKALLESGAPPESVVCIEVPGAFEIPLAAKKAAESGRFDAIIAVGCVIRGETPHFEYISQTVTAGLGRVTLDSGLPIAFGVLTVNTVEQAQARSGPGADNKGFEAAQAAIEMVHVLKSI